MSIIYVLWNETINKQLRPPPRLHVHWCTELNSQCIKRGCMYKGRTNKSRITQYISFIDDMWMYLDAPKISGLGCNNNNHSTSMWKTIKIQFGYFDKSYLIHNALSEEVNIHKNATRNPLTLARVPAYVLCYVCKQINNMLGWMLGYTATNMY